MRPSQAAPRPHRPDLTPIQSHAEMMPAMNPVRLPHNPIIHPGLDPAIGENINGPSLIRVPDWVPNPLGRYYLYFGHHQGTYIRLAYADDLSGPWHIHGPGTLRLEQTVCVGHIASPDAHVDDARREIVLYFHGPISDTIRNHRGQRSFYAVSADGLTFTASDTVLGPFYFRVFQHGGWHYAIAKSMMHDGGGMLLRAQDGRSPFEEGQEILPRQRHVAVLKRDDVLRIFYTRGGDAPERILCSDMPLTDDWRAWSPGAPGEVLTPSTAWEGGALPVEPSTFGVVHQPVRQLRDPAIFCAGDNTYLLYSVAGEQGIAIAQLRELPEASDGTG